MSPRPSDRHDARRAIVDIGSNSLRLVIYAAPTRVPSILYNEKVAVGLGRNLAETGAIGEDSFDAGVAACRRFVAVLKAAGVKDVKTVATAAARDASDGPEFLAAVYAAGLKPELLAGTEEAIASALGVRSAFPGANGIAGDIGGGSLELVELRDDAFERPASFPLGTLRLPALHGKGGKLDAKAIRKMLKEGGWPAQDSATDYYSVGGTGRALAALDLHLLGVRVPIVHGHIIPAKRLELLREAIAERDLGELRRIPGIASARVPMLDDLAALFEVLADHLGIERFVISGFGLREGLLFQALDPAVQNLDPLIEGARGWQQRSGRPGWDGETVARWIAPLFANESAEEAAIRTAACLVSGGGLEEESEARAEHALDVALLGAWIGIDARGRELLAQALYTAWGGKGRPDAITETHQLAMRWGEAIRLAERLGANHSAPLSRGSLSLKGKDVVLTLGHADEALYGDIVRKQHRTVAAAFGGDAVLALA
jgi:exopolyphosphatase / guanosine-5'-triphosphate,3'-diphosphate pyrophosphatase